MENFEWVSTGAASTQFLPRYRTGNAGQLAFSTAQKISGTRSLLGNAGISECWIQAPLSAGGCRSIHAGLWYRYTCGPGYQAYLNDDDPFLGLWSGYGYDFINLAHAPNGRMNFYSHATLRYLSAGRLAPNVWNYIELFFTLANSGHAKVAINGVEVLNNNSLDTQTATYINTVHAIRVNSMNAYYGGQDSFFDSIWVKGSADVETEPTFYGPIKIKHLVPDSDGNYEQWSSTASPTQYTEVDETGDIDTATYISTSTDGNKSSFGHAAVGLATGESIKAVGLMQALRKEAVGGGAVRPFVRVSGTDYTTGATIYHKGDTQYAQAQKYWENNPNTASAWTEAALDGAEFGIEYVDE